MDFEILDIGPISVRVEWSPSTFLSDDGGSPPLYVKLTYRQPEMQEEGAWSQTAVEVDVRRGFAVVNGLMGQTMYQIRMQVRNGIGKCTYQYCVLWL